MRRSQTAPFLLAYSALTGCVPWVLRWLAKAQHQKQGADPARLCERFGTATLARPTDPLIWLHAASVGEVQTLTALAPALAKQGKLLVTTATQTGAERAGASLPDGILHQFQPIDTKAATARFLDHWQPKLAVFAEADTPPNMLNALNARDIPAALVGARPSKSRASWPRTMTALLRRFQLITAASSTVSAELKALGFPTILVEDLKSQASMAAASPAWANELTHRPMWLAASTHPEDEALVFAAQTRILETHPDALLIIAPRHPDTHAVEVPDTFQTCYASHNQTPHSATQVFVMDKMGQLPGLHAACAVTYLGGAMGSRGGHSPWEAAVAGSHILTGPKISNNRGAFEAVPHTIVTDAKALATAVTSAWILPRPPKQQPDNGTATLDALLKLLAKGTA